MQDSQRWPILGCFLSFFGIVLGLLGVAGLVYASYPLGIQQASNTAGGPGPLLKVTIPKSLRVSDTDIIRVNYEFALPPEVDSSGQMIIPEAYEDITITLQAASFDAAPPSGQSVAHHVRNEVPHEWTWVVEPQREGEQHIVLQFVGVRGPLLAEIATQLGVDQLPENSTIMSTRDWSFEESTKRANDPGYTLSLVVPVSVVTVLGLTAVQARAVSVVVALLGSGGTVIGGAVTVLYKWYQGRKPKDKEEKKEGKKKRRSSKRKRRS